VVGGLGSTLDSTVSRTSSVLSFGDSSPSLLSFGS
jgi:hypothetical protein